MFLWECDASDTASFLGLWSKHTLSVLDIPAIPLDTCTAHAHSDRYRYKKQVVAQREHHHKHTYLFLNYAHI